MDSRWLTKPKLVAANLPSETILEELKRFAQEDDYAAERKRAESEEANADMDSWLGKKLASCFNEDPSTVKRCRA